MKAPPKGHLWPAGPSKGWCWQVSFRCSHGESQKQEQLGWAGRPERPPSTGPRGHLCPFPPQPGSQWPATSLGVLWMGSQVGDAPLPGPQPVWSLLGGCTSSGCISESEAAEAILLHGEPQGDGAAKSRKETSRTPPPSFQPCAPTHQWSFSNVLIYNSMLPLCSQNPHEDPV